MMPEVVAATGHLGRPLQTASARAGYTLRDLLIFAFYSWRTIIVAALIPLLIGGVAAVYAKKYYSSTGLLLVLVSREQSGSNGVSSNGPSVVSVEGLNLVQSEAEIVVSDAVLNKVVRRIGYAVLYPEVASRRLFGLLSALPEEERAKRAVELLRRDLKAEVREDSSIVRVTYRHVDPQIAARVATEIIRSYEEHRRTVYDAPRSPLLTEELARFTADLDGIDGQILETKKRYGILDIDQDMNMAVNQADILLQRKRQAQERLATVATQAARTEVHIGELPERLFDFYESTNQITNDEDRNLLTKLELDLLNLQRNYSPDYPAVKQVQERIARLKASIAAKAAPQYHSQREVRNPTLDVMQSRLFELQVERDALKNQIEELDRLHVEAAARIDVLREAQFTLHQLERSRKVMEEIHQEYAVRAEALKIDEKAALLQSSNVRVVEMPEVPVTGSTMAWSFLAAGVFGAIMTGFAGGMAANWNRQVFLLPGEAEKRLGLTALASFVVGAPRPGDRASEEEMSHLASQILDTRIDDRGLGAVQLLPIGPGGADVAVIGSLITECAGHRGYKVLLVDLFDGMPIARALGARAGAGATEDLPVGACAPLPG
ncbi:MAG: hypothetical protein PHS60_17510, partial [Zavarzinia sp.]|nr:hypothetical protein [Zavarzinia sp.]